MNWVDLILILIVLLSAWVGFRRGFIIGSLDLVSWATSFVMAYMFYDYTKTFLAKFFILNVWLLPVSFLVTLLITRLVLALVVAAVVRALPDRFHAHGVNKLFGLVPGFITGIILSVITAALLLSLPLKDTINAEARDSQLAGPLAIQSEWANKKLAPVFDAAVRHTLNSLTVHPSSHEKITLGFKYDRGKVRPFLEVEMLKLVNEERTKRGLKPLKPDPALTAVARAHSADMMKRGYFAHENPEGLSPFDRMRNAHITFYSAGENLALAQTLEIAHTNLMNSPGHRANILQPSFGRLGIGIVDGGFYGLMISQEFRD
jgi:uncharacterized protein YkwD